MTRRLGEVLDPAETAALCRAVAAHDAFLANGNASDAPGAHRDAARASSRGHASGGDAVVRFGARREGVRGARRLRRARLQNRFAAARARRRRRAYGGVLLGRQRGGGILQPQEVGQSRAGVGNDVAASGRHLARRRGGVERSGGGAAAFAATLGALRDASSAPAAAAAAPALARAGAALLGAVAARPGPDAVAAGDAPAWAAARRAAYRELRRARAARWTSSWRFVFWARGAAPTPALARAARSAELAGTMLRGAFAGVPPVAFARHPRTRRRRFRPRLAPVPVRPGVAVASRLARGGRGTRRRRRRRKNENAWRLEDALADAGVCAPPPPAGRRRLRPRRAPRARGSGWKCERTEGKKPERSEKGEVSSRRRRATRRARADNSY